MRLNRTKRSKYMQEIFNILFPLSITLMIETGIYMIIKHRDMKLFIVVSLLNLVLNPLMNVLLSWCIKEEYYWLFLSVFEIFTTLIESLVIWLFIKNKYLRILLFAILANSVSFGVGVALSFVFQTKITIIVLTSLFFAIYLVTYLVVFFSFCKQQRKES